MDIYEVITFIFSDGTEEHHYNRMCDPKFLDSFLINTKYAKAKLNRAWYRDGNLHRDDDLPAVEWFNGNKWWFQDGKRHRDNDLPAVEYHEGSKEWWVNGVKIRESHTV